MNGLEKVVEYIRADAEKECLEIIENGADECDQISADFSKREQGEYWAAINKGTKSAEQQLESLGNLAAAEAKKQITTMQLEMADEAFRLATAKLRELSKDDFALLLGKLGIPSGISPEDLVAMHKERLLRTVLSTLFD